jgi:ribosomal protein S12 methylthiotransferase accessory factor YcaO
MLQRFNTYKYVKGYKWTHQDNIPSVIGVKDLLKNETFEKEDFEFLKMKSELLRHWIPGRSLITKKEIFIPPMFIKWISATNGLASGNTIEEATLHACYEIFERFALISFLKDPSYTAPTIDNGSIKNKTIENLIKFFENYDFDITIKDLSFGSLFPVCAVIFTNKTLSSNCLMYNTIKAGASFNSEQAIIRCFTERLQGTDLEFETKNAIGRDAFVQNDFLPLFFEGVCPINLTNYRDGKIALFIPYRENNLNSAIDRCIDIAKRMKTDIIVVDHTHPVLDFPTVRVIMPGLSDFIKWWDPKKVTRSFLGNYNSEREHYQDKLFKVINSFFK